MYEDPEAYEKVVIGLQGRQEVANAVRKIVEEHFNGKRPLSARDIACGTGIIAHELSKVCDHVIGSDMSQTMLTHARRTKDPHIEWRTEDFHNLQGESHSTDIITMIAASRYVHHPDTFYQSIQRLLSENGIAILSYADTPRSKLVPLLHAERDAGLKLAHVQEYPPPAWLAEMRPKLLGRGIWRWLQRMRDMSIRTLRKESKSQPQP